MDVAATVSERYPGLDPGPLPTLSESVEADLHHLETERLKRDLAAMVAMDATIARSIASNMMTGVASAETTAGAIKLQSWWRQRVAQAKLATLMLEKFEADEARQRLREQRLVEDTLQLLDRWDVLVDGARLNLNMLDWHCKTT
ncbi:hypothetical protein DYB32_007510 [Aphanomyces invadans]|uniref:Uncharacterized protein n=1 Tax=Aphanomyces invadans TaxID=157072 RepID=A0A3R6Z0D3_9STRA|nr:hypothetical protein DYB32_007510 [Aphanomyces invadans]